MVPAHTQESSWPPHLLLNRTAGTYRTAPLPASPCMPLSLLPAPHGLQIHSAAQQAVQAGAGDLQATAAALQRMGWSTRVCSSLGGTLRQLRHTFLIATRHTVVRGERLSHVLSPRRWRGATLVSH